MIVASHVRGHVRAAAVATTEEPRTKRIGVQNARHLLVTPTSPDTTLWYDTLPHATLRCDNLDRLPT